MSRRPVYLGIDTSNYTTSAAVCDTEGCVLANLKVPLPVREGECGLRQSDAVFAHTKNMPILMAKCREALGDTYTPVAVGVSATPRDAEGSYMPCFLAGQAAASAVCAASDLPMYTFSHQNGHIRAALYSSGRQDELMGKPFCAFHVSGGTTEVLYVTPDGARTFRVEQVGGTADINAGQAIDRVGVMMGLCFPCGPALEELAKQNTKKVPKPRICVRDGVCNLSGLENLAGKLYRESGDAALTAAYVLAFIGDTLTRMTEHLLEKYPGTPVLYAGGVMSNRYLQARLRDVCDASFAEPAFSADNAAGIALLCRESHMKAEGRA